MANTVRYRYLGDKQAADRLRLRHGVRLLREFLSLTGFQNLKQNRRRVVFDDGSFVNMVFMFGQVSMEFFAPTPVLVKPEFLRDEPIAGLFPAFEVFTKDYERAGLLIATGGGWNPPYILVPAIMDLTEVWYEAEWRSGWLDADPGERKGGVVYLGPSPHPLLGEISAEAPIAVTDIPCNADAEVTLEWPESLEFETYSAPWSGDAYWSKWEGHCPGYADVYVIGAYSRDWTLNWTGAYETEVHVNGEVLDLNRELETYEDSKETGYGTKLEHYLEIGSAPPTTTADLWEDFENASWVHYDWDWPDHWILQDYDCEGWDVVWHEEPELYQYTRLNAQLVLHRDREFLYNGSSDLFQAATSFRDVNNGGILKNSYRRESTEIEHRDYNRLYEDREYFYEGYPYEECTTYSNRKDDYWLRFGAQIDGEYHQIFNIECDNYYQEEEMQNIGAHTRYYELGDHRVFLASIYHKKGIGSESAIRRYVFWDNTNDGDARFQSDVTFDITDWSGQYSFPDGKGGNHPYHEIPDTDLITPGWIRLVEVTPAKV